MNRIHLAGVDREHAALREPLLAAFARVVERGDFIFGEEVRGLERAMAERVGVAHAIGCANGTDALVLALRAVGVGPGDEVIVPSFTFIATAEAVALVGATPVFADVSEEDMLLDVASVVELLNDKTRAVIPVHLFGRCFDPRALRRAIGDQVAIIEDAAQAHDASIGDKRAGALGDLATFSFYPTKNLGAPGDAGMVTTDDERLAARVRSLANHGTAAERYHHDKIGTNSRLDTLQAAALMVKLPHLEAWTERRQENAARYRDALGGERKAQRVDGHHVYHHFTFRSAQRESDRTSLDERGIDSGVYYPVPLHEQPAYRGFAEGRPVPEVSARLAKQVLSVPVHPWLTVDEVDRVAEALGKL